jgi:putative hydrolase of the HAD superfamily
MPEMPSGSSGVKGLSEYRWLSFDVVGTLIDFEAGIVDAVQGIAAAAGVEVDPQHVLESFASAEDEQQQSTPRLTFTEMLDPVYRRMAAELGLPTGIEERGALRESIPDWPAFPDAVDAMAELGERYRLVALTNADNWALDRMATTLGSPFHDSVTAQDVGVNKPDPQVFAYCAGRQSAHGYTHDDWLHVAQSQYHDIATAKKMNVATCWIERRQNKAGFGATPSPAAVIEPDYHYSSLAELAAATRQVG